MTQQFSSSIGGVGKVRMEYIFASRMAEREACMVDGDDDDDDDSDDNDDDNDDDDDIDNNGNGRFSTRIQAAFKSDANIANQIAKQLLAGIQSSSWRLCNAYVRKECSDLQLRKYFQLETQWWHNLELRSPTVKDVNSENTLSDHQMILTIIQCLLDKLAYRQQAL
uniref:Uncharacterized protein n=1 Tax=Glossina palpalis gambiensis TaxID=67801 RepID=A0A1B0AV96_9MUSC